ncbi:MAG: IS5 family transposase [Arcobacteraceae bacterium]|jgi:IS5 family transposase
MRYLKASKTIQVNLVKKIVMQDGSAKKNVKSKVIKRAYRNKPLTNAEHKENYKHSKTRVRVEHIFGTLTSQMNNALNLTSVGINRIKSTIGLMNLTYNLVRYEQLIRLKKVKIV